jgi:hypothetical protein
LNPIDSRDFTDGTTRPVYADGDRQYVEEGERVYGVWLVPEADEAVVIETRRGESR